MTTSGEAEETWNKKVTDRENKKIPERWKPSCCLVGNIQRKTFSYDTLESLGGSRCEASLCFRIFWTTTRVKVDKKNTEQFSELSMKETRDRKSVWHAKDIQRLATTNISCLAGANASKAFCVRSCFPRMNIL